MSWLASVLRHPATLVAVGSAVGGNLRYWLGRWIDQQHWAGGIPWGTFVVNVSGSFLVGFLAFLLAERVNPTQRDIYLLLGVGLCGGYTTFSTFELETYLMIKEGKWAGALLNVGASVVCGFVAVVLGGALAMIFAKTGTND